MLGNSRVEKSTNNFGTLRRLSLAFAIAIVTTIGSFGVITSAQRQKGRVVNANDFPGQDLGAKINAADRALERAW